MTRCPKCLRWSFVVVEDEYHERDLHCVLCGYRPQRQPEAAEVARSYRADGVRPRHGGASL